MATLTKENAAKLNSVIDTCLLAGIENVLIENLDGNNIIRGINDDRTCLILSKVDVPELGPNVTIGLSRMNVLRSRMSVLSNDADFTVSYETNAKNEISVLGLKGSKAKTQFRCASPSIIKAPKAINDEDLAEIEINKNDVQTINAAAKAMGAKTFTLLGKKNSNDEIESYIEYYDTNQDVFSIKIADSVSFADEPSTFVYYYITDIFLSLIRQAATKLADNESSLKLAIGKGGTLRVTINNHEIIMVPQTNTQGD